LLHQFSTPDITFLGEQDGPAEQRLKEALAVLLGLNATVRRAYLVRVLYDGRTGGVMLGLLTDDEEECEKLVDQMGKAFAALFNTKAHLDIVFLSDEQDAEIRKACPPFYDRNASYH
jgi:SseB protein C-terminal domain